MKYIDADKLIAEIERLYDIARDASYNGEIEGEMTAYDKILSIITSLQQEQQEVDLDNLTIMKEIKKCGCNPNEFDIARHFYELGINARKEE